MRRLPSNPNPKLFWRSRPPEGVTPPSGWYRFWQWTYQMLATNVWRLQVFNRHLEPTTGSGLYLCNHQSFLDPAIMSLALRRTMHFMARDSLFRFPVFGPWIRSLQAFPVKRGRADMGAMKEALRRLQAGEQIMVFPEGTRTYDGTVGPFLPGVAMLARRAAEWVVPVVVDGAHEVWPRGTPLPWIDNIAVAYCEPISREDRENMTDKEMLHEARRRIIEMQTELRIRRGRPALRYPDKDGGA